MGKKGIVFIIFLLSFFLVSFSQNIDWEDQVIYFLMIDRFSNGNSENDIQTYNAIEYGKVNSKYNGGDLEGIIEKLDYIKGLGATAIWLTPPVENQWWDGAVTYGGYHGYWASNFKKIDPHFGDEEIYRKLIEKAHENGLYIIQDIVANHMGNFYTYNKENKTYMLNELSVPDIRPSQYPFNMNDYNDEEEKLLKIYNWESEIENPNIYNTSFADLDDLNTKNDLVIDELISSYKKWINLGVDGFRIDTVIYVEDEFWKKFLTGDKGILKDGTDFLVFGEAWKTPKPYENQAEKEINNYFELGFNSMLDFTLMTEINRVFKEGKPTSYLTYRLQQRNEFFKDKTMITFVDNHDTMRFLKGSTYIDMKQALTLIFTIPGIPAIYYGTEQGFSETRATMFKDGFASKGEDHFDTQSKDYLFIKRLSDMRKSSEAFTKGEIKVLFDTPNGPGPFIYSIEYAGEEYVIFFNTSSDNKYATGFYIGEEGTVLKPIYTEGMTSKDIVAGKSGIKNMLLSAKTIGIFKKEGISDKVKSNDLSVKVNYKNIDEEYESNFIITGTSDNVKKVRLFIDGNEKAYSECKVNESGEWKFQINIADFQSGKHLFFVKGYGKKPIDYEYSDTYEFDLNIPIEVIVEIEDPYGDDKGITGDYMYPKGEGGYESQMDIKNVEVQKIGMTLRIIIEMENLTDKWNPSNGFDHVTFQIFFDDPRKTGSKYLPFQNAVMINDRDWDYEIYATGWSLTMYSSDNSGKEEYGVPITPAPEIKVDKKAKTITILLPLDNLNTDNLEQWGLYITSFDYDGIEALLRPISPDPWKWAFYGPSENSPKIMDDVFIDFE